MPHQNRPSKSRILAGYQIIDFTLLFYFTLNFFDFGFCSLQRKDYSALVKYLPPKFEFVISIRLSPIQILLYEKYLDKFSSNPYSGRTDSTSVAGLFSDYQALMRIWTHPWVLKLDEIRQEKKVENTQLAVLVLGYGLF